MTQIDSILVSFVPKPYNAACAKLKDGSIMNLYVSTYNYQTRQQITVMPQYVPDPGQPTTLNIYQVQKIVMGIAQPGQEGNLCK
jgi:hypothetical protein